jgi:hypothetical protein
MQSVETTASVSVPISNGPKMLRRVEDRYRVVSRQRTLQEFQSSASGTLACLAAAAWWHYTSPCYRNPEPHRVVLTAATLIDLFGFPRLHKSELELACHDPITFVRRLTSPARILAGLIFDAMHPPAQWVGHIFATDYRHLGWWVEVDGHRREIRLLLIIDLYSRFIVAWATFVARPRSTQFREVLISLADAGLLCELLRFDNEGCFLSLDNDEWLKFYGVTSDPIAASLPQFNGVVERANRTVKDLLPTEEPSACRDICEDEIAYVLKYYNHVRHGSTHETPQNLARHFIREPLAFYFPL